MGFEYRARLAAIFRRTIARWLTICLFHLVAQPLSARDLEVASIEELRSALAKAVPGHKIVVADGEYTNEHQVNIAVAGTKDQPIEICARNIGGVTINGSAGFSFSPSAAYAILRGFKFTHQAGTVTLPAGAHHCRITRNVFELKVARSGSYLVIAGDDDEIDHNTFQNKKSEGKMLEVAGPESTAIAQRTWIHHNYFFNFENSHRNNSSALHVGLSSRSMSPAHSLVEHNLFVKTRGENEGAICNKSCDNIYRFNTFAEGCTELSLRHGNRCLVYGNFFIGTNGGLRFFGDDHKIFCNYFEHNHPAIQIGNGDGNVPPDKLTSHDRPDRVQIFGNTLVENESNVVMNDRKGGLGASNLIFANNVIQGGDRAISIAGPLANATWTGNVLWKTLAGDMPPSGYQSMNPRLTATRGSEHRLISSAATKCRVVSLSEDLDSDVDWKKMARLSDTATTQRSAASAENRSLIPSDVGPNAP